MAEYIYVSVDKATGEVIGSTRTGRFIPRTERDRGDTTLVSVSQAQFEEKFSSGKRRHERMGPSRRRWNGTEFEEIPDTRVLMRFVPVTVEIVVGDETAQVLIEAIDDKGNLRTDADGVYVVPLGDGRSMRLRIQNGTASLAVPTRRPYSVILSHGENWKAVDPLRVVVHAAQLDD